MKILKSVTTIIALFTLLSTPFSYMPICDAEPDGGLICYCCSDAGKKCAMISCSGCKGKAGTDVIPWSPEMILDSIDPIMPLQTLYHQTGSSLLPGTVYIDVPVKPPNSL